MHTFHSIDYESIFQLAPLGMCVSQNRRIVSANLALCAMFGYRDEELIGLSFSMLYPSQDEFERTGSRIAPILNATGSYRDERIMKRANQELFWCHVTGRALQQDDAHAFGIWTFEDLSAKRSVNKALTAREREISALLAEGQTSKQIARHLTLSPRTVEMYRAKLMKKLGATSASELINKLLRISAE
ncbi:MAG: PAS and helix-turn-helix domain-containing protein [Undibacterium sp.]|nr:PAS and helix-turn-helix domain-containing protein [Undibacterium sp.]